MPFQNVISNCPPMECGLVFVVCEQSVPVPLKSVSVKTKVVDFVAEVTIEQKYVNQEKNPIEAIYMFPIEEEAAVVNFTAEVEGRTIKTEVRKKEEAKAAYDKAMQDHRTAVLLEETTPDIFQIKLGQLKPGSGATIRIVYISELPTEEKSIRLTVPTTIAPRYVPPTDNSEAAKAIAAIPYSLNTPAPLTFDLEIVSQTKIVSVKSPSHSLETEITDSANDKGQFSAHSKLAAKTSDLDRDLVVLISNSDPHKPTVFIERSDEDPMIAAMVSLVPSFKLTDQKTEMIFLVDRSGSMGPGYSYEKNEPNEGSIGAARKALGLFLHSLPSDCYFNIFSFGSQFNSLFKGSVKYDDTTLQQAKDHVQGMQADYGGTEIYQPLEAIFKEKVQSGYLRQIFVLTDGEVSNSGSVVDLVKRNNSQGRVFALGLGASASRHLVKGIARSGGGTAVFAAEGEDLRPKVMGQLKNAMQPSISEVKVVWDGFVDEVDNAFEPELEKKRTLLGFMKPKEEMKRVLRLDGQAPARIPPIYDGTRLLVYRLFAADAIPKTVKITAQTPDGPLSVDLPVEEKSILAGNFVHQLAARKRIQDLEETVLEEEGAPKKDEIEKAVVELAIKYRLASKHTSFVGVDDKAGKNDFELAMNTRDIKNQVPSGFGYGGGPVPMMAMCMSAPVPQMRGGVTRFRCKGSANTAPMMGGGMNLMSKCAGQPQRQMMADCAPAVESFSLDAEAEEMDDCADAADEVGMDCFLSSDGVREEPEKRAKAKPAKEEDKLTSLIDLQCSDGHFKWGNGLARLTGKSREDLAAKRPSLVESDDLWLTAIAIVLLEAMSADKDLWELVVQKARKFLAKTIKNEDIEKLLEAARLI